MYDQQAVSILDNYLYKNWKTQSTARQVYSMTLSDTANRIMTITPPLQRLILPWFICVLVIIMCIALLPSILRLYAKKKQVDILKAKAELLSVPVAGLDDYDDSLLATYTDTSPYVQTPTYKPPLNSTNDPYAAKPQGFSAQQATKGYPQAPAQLPLHDPDSPINSSVSEYAEFKHALQVQGITGTEMEIYIKFEQFKLLRGTNPRK